jgi:hypothetical protein
MTISSQHEELTNWTRNDLQGVIGDASIIEKAIPVPEQNDEDIVDEDDDNGDTYIDDGHVPPINSLGQGQDDVFFLHKCDSICIGAIFLAESLVQELRNFLFDLSLGS